MRHVFKFIALKTLRLYQIAISPFLGANCRFHPSCSHYAIEAIERFGVFAGSYLALRRLSRCHPMNPGGFDPVPTEFKFFKRSHLKEEA
ncbi:MAG: membrane protein insertion efficiency factor YidD [Deefgea sp.]